MMKPTKQIRKGRKYEPQSKIKEDGTIETHKFIRNATDSPEARKWRKYYSEVLNTYTSIRAEYM